MAKLAIRTSNFQLSYKLIKQLRSRNINFDVIDPAEKLSSKEVIWFAESHEIFAKRINSIEKQVTSYDICEKCVENLHKGFIVNFL